MRKMRDENDGDEIGNRTFLVAHDEIGVMFGFRVEGGALGGGGDA